MFTHCLYEIKKSCNSCFTSFDDLYELYAFLSRAMSGGYAVARPAVARIGANVWCLAARLAAVFKATKLDRLLVR